MATVLIVTPPFVQMNTPYPASAYLKGFLTTKGISADQLDLGLEVILELFSSDGLHSVFTEVDSHIITCSDNAKRIFGMRHIYTSTVDVVISFLQGKNPTMARRICSDFFLPKAARFDQLEDSEWAFGHMGMQDKAKYFCTLYLEDLSDFIVECVDERFGFGRYAERLGRSANSFDELYAALNDKPTFIDRITLGILEKAFAVISPALVCFTVPFPGNLYSAFRCAQYIKAKDNDIKIALGGGFPNTELRSLKDVRVFEFFDFVTLDDGELPLELIISNIQDTSVGNPNYNAYKRTFLLQDNKVVYNNLSLRQDYKQIDVGTPDYEGLRLNDYVQVITIANPMHSLWSDGRWNKLTMAHGCYWGKCTFCDISLDYIKNYEPLTASVLVDRMEQMINQTGENGFHFVDEAAPPSLMKEVALEILRRGLVVSWWTNIRFEKSFTQDLCILLRKSGCIAVSGGLEVASNRLLDLIKKGVSVEQVARVCNHFKDAGIMVHAYLMYGFPTQTDQETIDSLEMVRQMFELELMQSAFWHQFALTAHSPVGLAPEDYGLHPVVTEITFANNDIDFKDSTGVNHEKYSEGLVSSLYNYMHGHMLEAPLQDWFDFKIKKTSVPKAFIGNALNNGEDKSPNHNQKVFYLGPSPMISIAEDIWTFVFHTEEQTIEVAMESELGEWVAQLLKITTINSKPHHTLGEIKASFVAHINEFYDDFTFEEFLLSDEYDTIRQAGLVVV